MIPLDNWFGICHDNKHLNILGWFFLLDTGLYIVCKQNIFDNDYVVLNLMRSNEMKNNVIPILQLAAD